MKSLKKLAVLLLFVCMPLAFPLPVASENGPKPSIIINMDDYYAEIIAILQWNTPS